MISTERLVLRGWRASDIEPFYAMGKDQQVMRYIGPPQSRADVAATLDRQEALLADRGYCFWAIERTRDAAFLGFCGLKPGPSGTPIEGEVEIGWRLARAIWGRGYAGEAARASLAWAWENLDVPSVAAITVPDNSRSIALMERLGMRRDAVDDFDHPNVPAGSPLSRHVVHRIARPADA